MKQNGSKVKPRHAFKQRNWNTFPNQVGNVQRGLEASPRPWSCTFIMGVQSFKHFQFFVMKFERLKYVDHVILKTLTCHWKVVDEDYKIMMSYVWIKSISWKDIWVG